MSDKRNLITADGLRALRAEFDYLRVHMRKEVLARLAEAEANDSPAGKADSYYRRKHLRELDRRCVFLEERISQAEVAGAQPLDQVAFGSIVIVSDEVGKKVVYQLVGVHEAIPRQGKISWQSSTAMALWGQRVSACILVPTSAGRRQLTVVSIENPNPAKPETNGLVSS